MILKGSQRGGAKQLSLHLMNVRDNDHVTLYQIRGFVADDLHGALAEAYAISKGTKCEQFLFSLSLNPPKDIVANEEDLERAADRAEKALGLANQPRAIVFHEKEGRRHAHVVWSRIDAVTMTAINLPHFKNRLMGLSRELYLDHGWDLPEGLRRDGGKSPLNFTLGEWQQAKRLKLDPREIKQSFQEAWQRSDSAKAFKHALEAKGYFLAKGDRRGFVALDINGEVFSVPRMLGIKAKEVREKLGDPSDVTGVEDTKTLISGKVTEKLRQFVDQVDARHDADFAPLDQARKDMVQKQRLEREKLKQAQKHRWEKESRARTAKLNKGLRGLWDAVSGRAKAIKSQNQQEAWQGLKRDQRQRDDLVVAQMTDRRDLQREIERLRRKHAQNRRILARDIAQALRMAEHSEERPESVRRRGPDRLPKGRSIPSPRL